MIDSDKSLRLSHVAQLQTACEGWPTLRLLHIQARIDQLKNDLVVTNSDETRGRIKELNDLLDLPQRLQQEALMLQQPQEDVGNLA